jgi:hypothetical protein
MSVLQVNFSSVQIFRGVQIEEPTRCGQIERMRDLTALNQGFDWNHGHRFTEAIRGSLESGKTASAAGVQFPFEYR